MKCQVENALNKQMREWEANEREEEAEQNRKDEAVERLRVTIIDDYLKEIQEKIDIVLDLATDFDGYELKDEAVEILNDKIEGL